MSFFWPNLLSHLPHWFLCPHTIFTYFFSFSHLLKTPSIHFLRSFFQNNSDFSWSSSGWLFLLLSICVVISSPVTSLSSSCLTFLESSSKHVLHERELYFGNSYAVFFLFEAELIHLKGIFVVTSIIVVPWSRHSECFCNAPAGPRLGSFKAKSFMSTAGRPSVQAPLCRYVQAFIHHYMWDLDSTDLVVVSQLSFLEYLNNKGKNPNQFGWWLFIEKKLLKGSKLLLHICWETFDEDIHWWE